MALASKSGVKILAPHREGCRGHEVGGYRCPDGSIDTLDRAGRNLKRYSWILWHRFKCNDIDCPSVVLVREDVLTEQVNRLAHAALTGGRGAAASGLETISKPPAPSEGET